MRLRSSPWAACLRLLILSSIVPRRQRELYRQDRAAPSRSGRPGCRRCSSRRSARGAAIFRFMLACFLHHAVDITLVEVVDAVMVTFCSLPVALSLAVTLRMPLASIRRSLPPAAYRVEPWNTVKAEPSKRHVVRRQGALALKHMDIHRSLVVSSSRIVSVLRTGMVVLRSIILVITPPSVSTPSESGVTSSSKMSLTSPPSTPP